MAKKKTQFDFRRYGRFLLIGATIAGLYLCKDAAGCFKERIDAFNLAGVVDDGSSSGLIGDGGIKKGTKGDYSKNFEEGSGFFGYMGASIPYCVEKSDFKNPIVVFYAFLGLLGLGLLFTFLEKATTPTWKKELKQKNADEAEDKRRQERLGDDIEQQRAADRRKKKERKIEAIEVEGLDEGLDVSNLLMHNEDHADTASSLGSRKKKRRKRRSEEAEEFGDELGRDRGLSDAKRDELAALGLGTAEALDLSTPPPSGMSQSRRATSTDGLMSVAQSGDEAAPEEPLSSVRRKARRPLNVVAAQVNEASLDGPGLASAADHSPSSVSVQSTNRMEDRANLWMPIGRVDDAFVYVVPEDDAEAPGVRDGTRMNRALGGLKAGIEAAEALVAQGRLVQIRLLPGIYREQIKVPSGVSLINHHIPRNLSTDELRFWLTGTEENDHEQHVVVALPPGADPNTYALTCEDATEVIIAGLHIVGRGELDEEGESSGGGVSMTRTTVGTFFLCHFVGHRIAGDGAAVSLEDCGEQVEERILLQDCLLELNAASGRGGAVFSKGSVLILRGCAMQGNQAASAGGAVFTSHGGMPARLEDCTLTLNTVGGPGDLPSSSRGGWRGEVGHGGGIFVDRSGLHLLRTDLNENSAQGSGGAIYATASRILIEGNPEGNPSRIAGNSALRGGAVLMAGTAQAQEALTAMRATNVEFIANKARESGGAIASYCLVHIDLKACGLLQNTVEAEHGEGGGLHANLGSRVKLTETTISRNSASFRGSGLSICNSSLRVFKGCTLTDNVTDQGDSALAFYTMESQFLPELKEAQLLEDPVVCAIGPCAIRGNHAKRGVGGLFIGNYVKTPTNPIAFALKNPEMISDNTIEGQDGEPVNREQINRARPVDLMIAWKGAIRNDDARPPTGKRILR